MEYNQARWYSHVKLFNKALPIYGKLVEEQSQDVIGQMALINSLVICKDITEYDMVQ